MAFRDVLDLNFTGFFFMLYVIAGIIFGKEKIAVSQLKKERELK
ncbi:hypothetical protein JCM10914A_01650 [Paenibacillus sp. JCM 10914]